SRGGRAKEKDAPLVLSQAALTDPNDSGVFSSLLRPFTFGGTKHEHELAGLTASSERPNNRGRALSNLNGISVYRRDEMRIAAIVLTLMVFSTSAFAECYTNARGREVCSNG